MDYLIPPWRHQHDGIALARKHAELALFFEMGTGKTGTIINILREHFARNKRVLRTLILGPAITVKNWRDEFKLHSKIKDHDIIMLVGAGKKRVHTFTETATDPKTHTLTRGKIFITNYEAMEMEELHQLLCQWQPEILVCDESHRLKNGQSVRAKRVIGLLGEEPIIGTKREYTRKVQHCYILTGTPILNTALDIFNQYRILDSGKTFGLNFYEFRGTYFEDENKGMPSQRHFPKWVPRPETYEILNEKIYRKALRVLKKDCLDLPPLVRMKIEVEMGKEQRRLYNEMKNEYITWIKAHKDSDEPRAVVAQMALTKALRLQQIVSGFVKTEDGAEVAIKDNPRLDAVDELLQELTPSHKVILWATFHNNYRALADVCKRRKIDYAELHGGLNPTEKNKSIDRFRGDSDCRVIIANQGAAGVGINLVAHKNVVDKGEASYSVFYSKNFSLEQDLQAESRNYRGGSEVYESVTRIDLVAKETIDELILEALASKRNIAEQVLDWEDKL
jgi:SNF2 family DNA or RNA helicase